MTLRLDYARASPGGYRALVAMHRAVAESGLDPALVRMVYLRVSQINGCAYCVDLHWRDAVAAGVPPRKLNALAPWADSGFFTPPECAALAWAESLTRLPDGGVPDAVFAATQAAFGEKGTADLAYAVALMGAFNRLGVGFRQPPSPEPT